MQPQPQPQPQPPHSPQVVYQPVFAPRRGGLATMGVSALHKFKTPIFAVMTVVQLTVVCGVIVSVGATSRDNDTIVNTAWYKGKMTGVSGVDTTLYLGLHDVVSRTTKPVHVTGKIAYDSDACDALEKSLDIFCSMCKDMGTATTVTASITLVLTIAALPSVVLRMTSRDSPVHKLLVLVLAMGSGCACVMSLILFLNGCADEMPSMFAGQQFGSYEYELGPSASLTVLAVVAMLGLFVVNLLVPVAPLDPATTGYVAAPGGMYAHQPQYAQPQYAQPQYAQPQYAQPSMVVQGSVVEPAQASEGKALV